jgi:2-keto-4-pentenoate hydratase/2-oxohepta-3-ene-1,7-dioic acid hydratase in catechol pathway
MSFRMKWCRFQSGESASYGLVEDGSVAAVSGDPFGGYTPTRTVHSLESVKLLVPVVPPTFYAAGVNYREHVTEMAKLRGAEPQFPPAADVGYRANNALIAQDENVVIPKDAGELVQYEGDGRSDRPQVQARY